MNQSVETHIVQFNTEDEKTGSGICCRPLYGFHNVQIKKLSNEYQSSHFKLHVCYSVKYLLRKPD
jgi:hypothetical protein